MRDGADIAKGGDGGEKDRVGGEGERKKARELVVWRKTGIFVV